ncbi:MAG: alanine--glyoxylate aminotransferase family protein [Candidatus Zixiibacteriota bacterium]
MTLTGPIDSELWMFIPGPVNVHPDVRRSLATPPINHRGREFSELYERVCAKVRRLLRTEGRVYLSTSSAIGIQEAVARNCVAKRSLHLVCGAFSQNWQEIAVACGKQADALSVEWGRANLPDALEEALAKTHYDTVCVVHSETSTSVQNPLSALAAVVRRFPGTLLCVDAVSSLGAAPVLVDDWGVDVCFASVQKGLALPPGFAVFSVSERALERAASVPNRGYYFDFLVFEEYAKKSQTPTTPSLPHMFALDVQLGRIETEGLENRWERHRTMATMAQRWAEERYECFAEAPHRSASVTAVRNTRGTDIAKLNAHLKSLGMVLAPGYGRIKSETFRIGHVGETTPVQLQRLLDAIDTFIG